MGPVRKAVDQPQLSAGEYRHNKSGKLYEVIGVALDADREQDWLVIYKPLYDCDIPLFARPYDNFTELIELHGQRMSRFEPVDKPRTFLA